MLLQSLVGTMVEVLVLHVWFAAGQVPLPNCLFTRFRLWTFYSSWVAIV